MSTENIQKFLATVYSDEKLAALLAHAQDGKLCFSSCCCFIGVATADHALQGACDGAFMVPHYKKAQVLDGLPHPSPFMLGDSEKEFMVLGKTDEERRERLIPLILAEMQRREAEKLPEPTGYVGEDGGYIPDWRDEEPQSDSLTAMEREKGFK